LDNKQFRLSCSEDSKAKIESLAEKLDYFVSDIKKGNPSASFELALIIAALDLMDDKNSRAQESGGEALKQANSDFQKSLSSIFSELKTVAKKLENC
jgi:cell division protein ZapA (FtsZ GTPase activity inhibitor)